ncbi:MAG: MGMT family protein [Candidatus Omnitrophota bacterium]
MKEKKNLEDFFSARIKNAIKHIPCGKVSTYGQIAALAGNHHAARQVAWVLHSFPEKEQMPWHRVINRRGEISLEPGFGYEEQRLLLEKEGIEFDKKDRINLERYLWNPSMEEKNFN